LIQKVDQQQLRRLKILVCFFSYSIVTQPKLWTRITKICQPAAAMGGILDVQTSLWIIAGSMVMNKD
jgi:hypothetical protein